MRRSPSRVLRSPLAVLPVVLAVSAAVSGPIAAQVIGVGGCVPASRNTDVRIMTVGSQLISYYSSPHMRCDSGIELWADSAISFANGDNHYFLGNVRLLDGTGELEADDVRYLPGVGRIEARGNMILTDTVQGFTIANGILDYLLANDFRPQAQLRVTMAPDGIRPVTRITVNPAAAAESPDSEDAGAAFADPAVGDPGVSVEVGGETETADDVEGASPDTVPAVEPEPTEPISYDIVSDRILILGGSFLQASGNAVVRRDSLVARGDTAEYSDSTGLRLLGSATVENSGYEVTGAVIDLSVIGRIDRLTAVGNARLSGTGIEVAAPWLSIDVDGGVVMGLSASMRAPANSSLADRIAAEPPDESAEPATAGPQRPVAVSGAFTVSGDFLRAISPNQILENIVAVGNARVVSSGRELDVEGLPEIARSDWIEGDSVKIIFLPPETPSLATTDRDEARVDRVTASGRASSVYRIDPPTPDSAEADTALLAPGIHYVTASEITIVMDDGEVWELLTEGSARGLHLEPFSGPDSIRVDTANATAETDSADTVIRTDTLTAAYPSAAAGSRAPAGDERSPAPPSGPEASPHTRRR